jgi:hypothetical protein
MTGGSAEPSLIPGLVGNVYPSRRSNGTMMEQQYFIFAFPCIEPRSIDRNQTN